MLDPPAACCINQHDSFQGAANSEADEHQKQVQLLQTPAPTKARFLQVCFCSCSGTAIPPTHSRRIPFLHAVVTGASVTCIIFGTSPLPAKRTEELETRAPISPLAAALSDLRDVPIFPHPSLLTPTQTQLRKTCQSHFFTSPPLASRSPRHY